MRCIRRGVKIAACMLRPMRKILGTSCSVVIALAGCAGPGPEVTDGSAPAAPETAPEQVAAEQPAETTPAPAVNAAPPAGATSTVALTTDTAIPTRDGTIRGDRIAWLAPYFARFPDRRAASTLRLPERMTSANLGGNLAAYFFPD